MDPLTADADMDPVPDKNVQVAVVALPPIVPLSGMVTGSHTACDQLRSLPPGVPPLNLRRGHAREARCQGGELGEIGEVQSSEGFDGPLREEATQRQGGIFAQSSVDVAKLCLPQKRRAGEVLQSPWILARQPTVNNVSGNYI